MRPSNKIIVVVRVKIKNIYYVHLPKKNYLQ